jgi:hypothetical protein
MIHSCGSAPYLHELKIRVVVVGGGFSGAAFAIHLARQTRVALSLQIVEPRAALGAGLAYGTTDPAHRVNVPAAGMTLLPSEPDHFIRWLHRGRAIEADPGMVDALGLFPRRSLFGIYVAETAAEAHGGLAAIRHVRDTAKRVIRWGRSWRVELGSGGWSCQVVGLMDALDRAARHLSCLRGHLDARLLPPDPEGLGTGIAVLSSRHQVPPRTEMAIDHRVG